MATKEIEAASKIALHFTRQGELKKILEYLTKNQIPLAFAAQQTLILPIDVGEKLLAEKRFRVKKIIPRKAKPYQVPAASLVYGRQYIF